MSTILDLPQLPFEITIIAGSDWLWDVQFVVGPDESSAPIDLTGIAFDMQMRRSVAPDEKNVWLSLSTEAGGIVNTGAAGIVKFHAPPHLTSQIPDGPYVADVVARADGYIRNLCETGPLAVTVRQPVTRL
jgi:hypothetical protein